MVRFGSQLYVLVAQCLIEGVNIPKCLICQYSSFLLSMLVSFGKMPHLEKDNVRSKVKDKGQSRPLHFPPSGKQPSWRCHKM